MARRLSSSQRMLAFAYWEAEASISSQEPFVGHSSRYIWERGLGKICSDIHGPQDTESSLPFIWASYSVFTVPMMLTIVLSIWRRRKPGHGRLDNLPRSSARKRLSQDLSSEMSAELYLPLSGLGNTSWSVFNWPRGIQPKRNIFLPSFLAYFLLSFFFDIFWDYNYIVSPFSFLSLNLSIYHSLLFQIHALFFHWLLLYTLYV